MVWILPPAIVVVTPRAMPKLVARTPNVVVVIRLVVVRVRAWLAINAFFNLHSRRNVVVIVVVLDDFGRCLPNNFAAFNIFALAVARTVEVGSKGRRGEEERQCGKGDAFHGDEILG
jgi:hypothetical protein